MDCPHKSFQWLLALLGRQSSDLRLRFSVMGISIERGFLAIYKIIFFVNRILLLLPVLRLAIIFLMCMVYLVFFTLYCFSALVCANLVGKSFGRFACLDLGSTFIDAVPWSVQLFLTILLLTGKNVFSKMPVDLIQYRGTVGIFNSQHFVLDLKHKSQHLLIHSHSNAFSHYACFFCNRVLLFLFLAVFLILKLHLTIIHLYQLFLLLLLKLG